MIEESGTKIVPMSDSLREEVRKAAESVTQEIQNSVSKEVVEAYTAE